MRFLRNVQYSAKILGDSGGFAGFIRKLCEVQRPKYGVSGVTGPLVKNNAIKTKVGASNTLIFLKIPATAIKNIIRIGDRTRTAKS